MLYMKEVELTARLMHSPNIEELMVAMNEPPASDKKKRWKSKPLAGAKPPSTTECSDLCPPSSPAR